MTLSHKRVLFIVGGSVGLLVLIALIVPLLVDANRFKPRLEAAASHALGMDVRAGGPLGLRLLPSPRITAEDGHVLGEQGETVASVRQASFWIAVLPLLRGEIRLRKVELQHLVLSIERSPEGRINVARVARAEGLPRAIDGVRVSVSEGVLQYADLSSGKKFEATGIRLNVSHMRLAGGKSPRSWKDFSLRAGLDCAEVRAKEFSMTDLKFRVHGEDGIFEVTPVTMRTFGGQMVGDLRADFSGPVPVCQLHASLPRFRIEEFLKTLAPEKAVEGAMDFSMSLSMQGGTLKELVQSAAGEASLRGSDLTLVGNDLDQAISRFESSQSLNLVDVGAVFLAGPLGVAVTRGYSFASLFRGSGGNSNIRTLVSDWKVEHGVANAQDVAFATSKNRLVLQGQLDFVNEQFAGVTVAVINEKGCATLRQAITGSFEKPVVEKPHVLASLAGPVLKLYKQTRALLPAAPCEVSYSGSVPPPQ